MDIINPKAGYFSLCLLLLLIFLSLIYIKRKGIKQIPIKKIASFDGIEEGINRAVEMGKNVHFTVGFGSLTTDKGPQYLAGLNVLAYTARLCAEKGVRLISTFGVPELVYSEEEIIRNAYQSCGRPELYDVTYNVRYLTNQQYAYASAVQAIIQRENVGTNICIGPFLGEAIIFMESAALAGAFNIAGTAHPTQIPFFVLAADYAFIGEEIFAAAALSTGDYKILSSLRVQDFGKLVSLLLIIIGLALLPLGITLASYIIK